MSLAKSILLIWLLFLGSSSAHQIPSEFTLVGSTPGDELVKRMLTIPAETKVDFIRWNVRLDPGNNFVLNITYGESQPNTLGFINGGEQRTVKGTFMISAENNFKQVYRLRSSGLSGEIAIAKLNENVFHLLTPINQLAIGNGGWSYSLNRKGPMGSGDILISSSITDKKSVQLIFDGRTPCREIAADHPEMNTSPSCFKLKWRLTLNKDPETFFPTTYTIRKVVDGIARDVSGKWTIIEGTKTNPEAIIYTIEPDKPGEAISFLAGDDNVLFFLDKNNEPYIGNENFSFTLNKRM